MIIMQKDEIVVLHEIIISEIFIFLFFIIDQINDILSNFINNDDGEAKIFVLLWDFIK